MTMVVWRMSDGTEVEARDGDVHVRGSSLFALERRDDATLARRGQGPHVDILAPPGGSIPFELGNVWLVDLWLRSAAARTHLSVKTEYVARDEDAPEEAQKLLARRATWSSAGGLNTIF